MLLMTSTWPLNKKLNEKYLPAIYVSNFSDVSTVISANDLNAATSKFKIEPAEFIISATISGNKFFSDSHSRLCFQLLKLMKTLAHNTLHRKCLFSEKCLFSGPYFSAFGLNTGKHRPQKLQIRTLFTQWYLDKKRITLQILFYDWR